MEDSPISGWSELPISQEPPSPYEKLPVKLAITSPIQLTGQTYNYDSLAGVFFEDMSMSTNTGPPSYDSFLLPIPNDCVGLIIGKQGDMIKKLRQSSNASVIQVAKDCAPGCNYRNVFIEGSLESYCLAKKMIYEIIDENNRAKRLPEFKLTHTLSSEPYIEMIVPELYIDLILGPELSTLRMLILESSAQILVPTKSAPGTNNRYITITGQPECIRKAKRMIHEILEPRYRSHAIANGIAVIQHEQIDPEFPYCSFYALILKAQAITMSACEHTANNNSTKPKIL